MVKYLIEYKRNVCIGAAACAAVKPETWQLANDGKVDFQESSAKKVSDDFFTLEIDEKDLSKHLEAAQVCPVNAIKIKNLETGKYVI